ncbi:unnamed protein product [Urochloa humidicola]
MAAATPHLGLILPQAVGPHIHRPLSSSSGHSSPHRAELFSPADSPAMSNQTQIARTHNTSTSLTTPSSIPEPQPRLVQPGIQGFPAGHSSAVPSSISTLTQLRSPSAQIQPTPMAKTSMPMGCSGRSSKDAENPLLCASRHRAQGCASITYSKIYYAANCEDGSTHPPPCLPKMLKRWEILLKPEERGKIDFWCKEMTTWGVRYRNRTEADAVTEDFI